MARWDPTKCYEGFESFCNNLKFVEVKVSDEDFAEVTLLDEWNNQRRHTVDLKNQNCSCRE